MLTQVLDPKNRDDFAWADSGYAGARYEDLLKVAGFESRIHEKGTRCHPLSEDSGGWVILHTTSCLTCTSL